MDVGARMIADETLRRAAEAFVYAEARLLDEGRFDAWLALFDDDGVYWVPGQPGQRTPQDGLSLLHERKPLLALRVARLADPQMHAHSPAVRTHHHVSAVEVGTIHPAGGEVEVRSSLIVAESRNGEDRWFAGRALHRLRGAAHGWRIVEKRVDLINCDAAHRALTVPF
jgi:benzoate/toluate 1,2-dioxygenase beta subunit